MGSRDKNELHRSCKYIMGEDRQPYDHARIHYQHLMSKTYPISHRSFPFLPDRLVFTGMFWVTMNHLLESSSRAQSLRLLCCSSSNAHDADPSTSFAFVSCPAEHDGNSAKH